MFIELTDHLRCPEPHDEAFLVLLPDRMAGRRVVAGQLGCPACGWNTAWEDGVPRFGEVEEAPDPGDPPFDAAGALALLGLEGPGGWVALAGRVGVLGEELAGLLPDVGIVAINPPPGIAPSDRVSVIRSPAWPVKRHALRGVVIGEDLAEWADGVLGSVLPGLRAVGEGAPPVDAPTRELLSATPGLWLVRQR